MAKLANVELACTCFLVECHFSLKLALIRNILSSLQLTVKSFPINEAAILSYSDMLPVVYHVEDTTGGGGQQLGGSN